MEIDTLIQKIELPASQAFNEAILKEDEEILKPVQLKSSESDAKTIKSDNEPDESDNKSIINISDNEDPELATALEDAYLSPPPTNDDEDSPCGFHIQYPCELNVER